MRSSILLTGIALAAATQASPASAAGQTPSASVLSKFANYKIVPSAGGKSTCIQGTLSVTASTAKGVKFDYDIPANNSVITATFVDMLTANNTFLDSITQGSTTIKGTYDIFTSLCYPKGGTFSSSVQFLIHGIGVSHSYWDFAPGYSFVDAATEAGYTTFSFDRLGVGLSDHPHPINVVQAPFELEIAHTMITGLRSGDLVGLCFDHVIGAGHSFGSIQTQALTYHYPSDLDAAVLTGFTTISPGIASFMSALNSAIARKAQPDRFKGLNNGYMVLNAPMGDQFAFWRFPYYDPTIFAEADAVKGEYTFGEFFTAGDITGVATNFTGPVDVVNGIADWPFCMGNCEYPVDQSALTITTLYPKASSGSASVVVPGLGHALNLHYNAPAMYAQVQKFVKDNGF